MLAINKRNGATKMKGTIIFKINIEKEDSFAKAVILFQNLMQKKLCHLVMCVVF